MADVIFDLFSKYGSLDYIGEEVTQEQHMLQCAHFAEKNMHDEEMILACLLHDVGHLVEFSARGSLGVIDHDRVGKVFLESLGFSLKVCILVGNHVQAKRYLVTMYPSYYDTLSDASKETLKQQGGRMSDTEMRLFECDPYFEESILLRKYDDSSKNIEMHTKTLQDYRHLIEKYLI